MGDEDRETQQPKLTKQASRVIFLVWSGICFGVGWTVPEGSPTAHIFIGLTWVVGLVWIANRSKDY